MVKTGAGGGAGLTDDSVVPCGPDSTAGVWKTARAGDCIASFAVEAGLFWQTIWNHASNAELKRRRNDPNVLLPGDAVFVPNKRLKEVPGDTDQRHKFRRKGEPFKFVVFLLVNDEPLANREFELDIDGTIIQGTTRPDGSITVSIPGNAKEGLLKVTVEDYVHEFTLALGTLDPINTMTGVQQRLGNLGYDCGPADGQMGPRTEAALSRFQAANTLTVNRQPDQPTQRKLLEKHKS